MFTLTRAELETLHELTMAEGFSPPEPLTLRGVLVAICAPDAARAVSQVYGRNVVALDEVDDVAELPAVARTWAELLDCDPAALVAETIEVSE